MLRDLFNPYIGLVVFFIYCSGYIFYLAVKDIPADDEDEEDEEGLSAEEEPFSVIEFFKALFLDLFTGRSIREYFRDADAEEEEEKNENGEPPHLVRIK